MLDMLPTDAVTQGAGQASSSVDLLNVAQTLSTASPALLFLLFIFALWKNWLILPRELKRLEVEAERERLETKRTTDALALRQQTDLEKANGTITDLTNTIIEKVVPAVTRVADPLIELVQFRRAQAQERGQIDAN